MEQGHGRAQLLRVQAAEDLLRAAPGYAGEHLGPSRSAAGPAPDARGRPGPRRARRSRTPGPWHSGRARAICGNTNHIQWLTLRPARSSATRPVEGPASILGGHEPLQAVRIIHQAGRAIPRIVRFHVNSLTRQSSLFGALRGPDWCDVHNAAQCHDLFTSSNLGAAPGPNGLVMMKKFAQRSRAALGAITVGGLIGLLAAAAALGVAELMAGFTGIAGEPVIAVGGAAIDLTPIPVKDFAIQHFGSHDKTRAADRDLRRARALRDGDRDRGPAPDRLRAGRTGRFRGPRRRRRPEPPRLQPARRATHGRGRGRRRAGHGPAGPRRTSAGRPARERHSRQRNLAGPRPPEIPAYRRRGGRPRGGRGRGRPGPAVPVQRVRGAFRHHPSRPGGHRAAAAGRRPARRPGDQPVHHTQRELLPG